jgi:hypothetical protein
MDKELPRFIKINPKFNLKNPSLEILSKKEEANDIPDI